MLQERINRVINNHQLSCGHTNHYIFILKGFTHVLKKYSVPVKDLDVVKIPTKTNFYITYEDAMTLGDGFVSALIEHEYDPWIVDFNFFEGGYLADIDSVDYTNRKPLANMLLVNYPEISWAPERKTIHIFNTNNPLIGIVDDPDTPRTNEDRLNIFLELE
ncbi:hypothetical protein G7061_01005 [Erysipelothrix sp. HDW6B]|uniref:hypothetical protein n=1 Tax=Erysipelothrix TaxID=1647 RepID=UPI001356C4D1|nr:MULTISPECIES: hypothetical protein [Erysipelothrix]QIK85277.1 hypothetical protein G7061_01005 [Erysipelothrix sp. HDW6B]